MIIAGSVGALTPYPISIEPNPPLTVETPSHLLTHYSITAMNQANPHLAKIGSFTATMTNTCASILSLSNHCHNNGQGGFFVIYVANIAQPAISDPRKRNCSLAEITNGRRREDVRLDS